MSKWICESCKKVLVLERGTKPVSCCYCGGTKLTIMPNKTQARTVRITENYEKELDEIAERINPKANEIRRLKSEMAQDVKRYREIISYFSQAKHRGTITEARFRELCSKYSGTSIPAEKAKPTREKR